MHPQEHTVIGGGVAGLASAISLARLGHSVRLLEHSAHLGGRAITASLRGFRFNLGPHALYRGGHAYRMLSEWGIAPAGARPEPGNHARLVFPNRLWTFPQSLKDLVFADLFNAREKLDIANALRKLQSTHPRQGGMLDWIRREVATEKAADFIRTLIRVGTYNDEHDLLSARAAIAQFQLAMESGVLYLDGGWQSVVDAMEAYALRLGVRVEKGVRDAEIPPGAILAVPPQQVEALTGVRLPKLRPVRMACLDLGLRSLPPNAPLFALGVDEPTYFSVHSRWAKLTAEVDSTVVHIGKYLGAQQQADRAELEALADLAMPGWRDLVLADRYFPNLTVTHSAPWIDAPRPAVDAIPGVFLAGDWIGDEAMLADASFASASRGAALASASKDRKAA
jgi:hypothetical protein